MSLSLSVETDPFCSAYNLLKRHMQCDSLKICPIISFALASQSLDVLGPDSVVVTCFIFLSLSSLLVLPLVRTLAFHFSRLRWEVILRRRIPRVSEEALESFVEQTVELESRLCKTTFARPSC